MGRKTTRDSNGNIKDADGYGKGSSYKKDGVEHTVEDFSKNGNLILKGPDNIRRTEKLPDDQLNVRVIIEITGSLRRVDLDRFTQSMSKTVAFEFEDGGGGQ